MKKDFQYLYFINSLSDVGTLVSGSIDGAEMLKIFGTLVSNSPDIRYKEIAEYICKEYEFQIVSDNLSLQDVLTHYSYHNLVYEGGYCEDNGIMDVRLGEIKNALQDILQGKIDKVCIPKGTDVKILEHEGKPEPDLPSLSDVCSEFKEQFDVSVI